MTNTSYTEVYFEDGSRAVVPEALAARIVGKDADGDLLVPLLDESLEFIVPLTPCCMASGKGGQRGVICRACYRSVAYKFGGFAEIDVRRVAAPETTPELRFARWLRNEVGVIGGDVDIETLFKQFLADA